jgi:hypothetical protein
MIEEIIGSARHKKFKAHFSKNQEKLPWNGRKRWIEAEISHCQANSGRRRKIGKIICLWDSQSSENM